MTASSFTIAELSAMKLDGELFFDAGSTNHSVGPWQATLSLRRLREVMSGLPSHAIAVGATARWCLVPDAPRPQRLHVSTLPGTRLSRESSPGLRISALRISRDEVITIDGMMVEQVISPRAPDRRRTHHQSDAQR